MWGDVDPAKVTPQQATVGDAWSAINNGLITPLSGAWDALGKIFTPIAYWDTPAKSAAVQNVLPTERFTTTANHNAQGLAWTQNTATFAALGVAAAVYYLLHKKA